MSGIFSLVLALSLLACKDKEGDDTGGTTATDADEDGYPEELDCNDIDAAINPAASEVCDGVDNDCDSLVDDQDADLITDSDSLWYVDTDGDGYGHWESWQLACEEPEGYANNAADCDDGDAEVSPDADEVCDGLDNDCSGDADDDAVDAPTWYLDEDIDGYGTEADSLVACDQPALYTDVVGDCADDDPDVSPGQVEICNDGLDNDCDSASTGGCEADLSAADLIFSGVLSYDEAGVSIVGLGDLDGDGFQDLGVGARNYDPGGVVDAGAAFVQFGPLSGPLALTVDMMDMSLLGAASGDKAGRNMAAGDVDGDGERDLVVAAPNADDGGAASGTVYVVLGDALPTGGEVALADAAIEVWGDATYDYLGVGVELTDVGGDGQVDLLLGASGSDLGPDNAGAVYLLQGPLGAGTVDLEDGGYTAAWMGAGNGDGIGLDFCASADFDGDGALDLAIGASANDAGGSEAGAMYLVLGIDNGLHDVADADLVLNGAATEQLGAAVACISDWDGDGYDDLAIGESGRDGDAGHDMGAVYVIGGAASFEGVGSSVTSLARASIQSEDEDDQLGADVGAAGDHDGDGVEDLVMGATNGGDENEGRAYLFYGPLSGALDAADADVTWRGVADEDHVGAVTRFVGDVGGLGTDAFAIGGIDADGASADVGAAYIVLETGP